MRRRLLLACSIVIALQLLLRLDLFASRDADVELVVAAVAALVDEQFVCATAPATPLRVAPSTIVFVSVPRARTEFCE